MNTPAEIDLKIYKNATFNFLFTWKGSDGNPINLTGYTAKLRIKEDYKKNEIIYLTTENGGIALGGALGTVSITIDETVTAAIKEKSGVYDLIMTSGSTNKMILRGVVNIFPNAT